MKAERIVLVGLLLTLAAAAAVAASSTISMDLGDGRPIPAVMVGASSLEALQQSKGPGRVELRLARGSVEDYPRLEQAIDTAQPLPGVVIRAPAQRGGTAVHIELQNARIARAEVVTGIDRVEESMTLTFIKVEHATALEKLAAPPAPSPPVHQWAVQARARLPRPDQLRSFQPATPQQRQAKRLSAQGQQLIGQVLATGGRLGPAEARTLETKMEAIVGGFDRLVWNEPIDGGIAECMKGCDDAYPGTGGGNGWNRFVCKFACLVHGGDNG